MKQPDLTEDHEFIKDIFRVEPSILEKFEWPPSGESAVFRSLCYHMDKFLRVRSGTIPPNQKEMSQLLNVVEHYMQGTAFSMPSNPPDYQEFKEMIAKNVDMTTSPGHPWIDLGA